MVHTRSEAAPQKASRPKRRFEVPRDAAVGIIVGIVVAGGLWWLIAIIYHHLAG